MLTVRCVACMVVLVGVVAHGASASSLEEIRQRGKLIVLSFPHQQSEFVRTNVELGPTPEVGPPEHFIGIDVDVMRLFAERLGVALEIRRSSQPSYGALIPDLLAGRGDLIASSLTITPKRLEQVDFSEPYFSVYPVVVVRADSGARSMADLAGKTAATVAGSSLEEHLDQLGVPEERMLPVEFTLDCFTAVADRQADYTLVDSIAAAMHIKDVAGLKVAFRLPGEDRYGYAVPKGSADLLAALNAFLADARKDGTLERIIASHTGAAQP